MLRIDFDSVIVRLHEDQWSHDLLIPMRIKTLKQHVLLPARYIKCIQQEARLLVDLDIL